jgi:hypothetical protein
MQKPNIPKRKGLLALLFLLIISVYVYGLITRLTSDSKPVKSKPIKIVPMEVQIG